jgi:prepilin peptidase CpaA
MIWAAFTILLLAAVVTDARSYRIPNWISIAVAGLFAFAVLVAVVKGAAVTSFWPNILIGVVILALGYGLYLFTGMGAGDAKFGAAIGLWTGFYGLYVWTFTLGLAMALLAIGLIVLRRVLPAGIAAKSEVFRKGAFVPLGIALSLSAIAASPWFTQTLFGF